MVGDTIPKSSEYITKWLHDHYLLNVFKASVSIILQILSSLSVVLRSLDDGIILMLPYLTLRSSPPRRLQ